MTTPEQAVEAAARALATNEGYAQPQKWNYEDAHLVLTAALPLLGVQRPDREDAARVLFLMDNPKADWEDEKTFARRHGLTWPTHSIVKYFTYADAVLALIPAQAGVQRREDVARAALVPFVDYLNVMMQGRREKDYPDHATVGGVEAVLHDPSTLKRTEITYGDLRRARAVLALPHTGQPQEGTRAETWKRLWKEERARYEALVEKAFAAVGKTPHEIAELVIGEWCVAGDKRNVRDHIVRTAELLGVPAAISAAPASPRAEGKD